MTYRCVFHSDVKTDYDEAYEWYELQKKGLGDKFIASVRYKMAQIALQPETYREKSKKGYREALIDDFPFSIVYKIYKRDKLIFVNAIHHYKKHPKKKYRR